MSIRSSVVAIAGNGQELSAVKPDGCVAHSKRLNKDNQASLGKTCVMLCPVALAQCSLKRNVLNEAVIGS